MTNEDLKTEALLLAAAFADPSIDDDTAREWQRDLLVRASEGAKLAKPLGHYMYKGVDVEKLMDTGTFRGYLSTWDIDLTRERFAEGAFTKSIFEYVAAGVMPAVLWQHDSDRLGRQYDTANVVGRLTSMKQDAKGLLVTGKLDLSTENGQAVYKLMRLGSVSMSVGFIGSRWVMEDDVKTFIEADVLEATITPTPANPEARILEVKRTGDADEAKAVNDGLAQRQMRGHLITNHNASLRMCAFDMRDLVLTHRLAHSALNTSATEHHLRTGDVGQGSPPITTGKDYRDNPTPKSAMDNVARAVKVDAAVERAKVEAERERLRDVGIRNSEAQAVVFAKAHGPTFAEEAALEQEAYLRDAAALAEADAERAEEAARRQLAETAGLAAFSEDTGIGEVTQ